MDERGKRIKYREAINGKDGYSVRLEDDTIILSTPEIDELYASYDPQSEEPEPTIKLLEVSASRSFDRTYEPVKDDKPLDVVQINLDKELTKVRWYNGESFMNWYSKPVEERYPLHPDFIDNKISHEDDST